MKKRSKNKKLQTFDVYQHLPRNLDNTGIPKYKEAGEFYTYNDYLTNALPMAVTGDETEIKNLNTYNLDSKNVNNTKTGYPEYGVPTSLQGSALAGLFNIGNSVNNAAKVFKTAKENKSFNINPATGKPYSKADFTKGDITNYSNQNVLLDPDGISAAFNKDGLLKNNSETNNADAIFMTQKEGQSRYFNALADYHSNTYVDENEFLADGTTPNPNYNKPLLSKQEMNTDGSINYAKIPNASFNPALDESETNQKFIVPTINDLTPGDLAQSNLKDVNVNRFKTDNDGNVSTFTSYNKDGNMEEQTYDEFFDYTSGDKSKVINEQERINNLMSGGSFPRNNLSAFVYGGSLLKAQNGVTDKEIAEQNALINSRMTNVNRNMDKNIDWSAYWGKRGYTSPPTTTTNPEVFRDGSYGNVTEGQFFGGVPPEYNQSVGRTTEGQFLIPPNPDKFIVDGFRGLPLGDTSKLQSLNTNIVPEYTASGPWDKTFTDQNELLMERYGGDLPKAENGNGGVYDIKNHTVKSEVNEMGVTEWTCNGEPCDKAEYDRLIAENNNSNNNNGGNNGGNNNIPTINTDVTFEASPGSNINPLQDPNDNFDWDNDGVPNSIDATPGDRPNADDSLYPEYGPANNPTPITQSFGDTPMQEKYNKLNAFTNTGPVGEARQVLEQTSGLLTGVADGYDQIYKDALGTVQGAINDNMNDELMDNATVIESSRDAKGRFDVNSGDFQVRSQIYGDGPYGQIAQMGQEMNAPLPDYTYLKQFLNNAIVGYDPEFLMRQADYGLEMIPQRKNGGQVIDADMNLIQQLISAGADFEML